MKKPKLIKRTPPYVPSGRVFRLRVSPDNVRWHTIYTGPLRGDEDEARRMVKGAVDGRQNWHKAAEVFELKRGLNKLLARYPEE